MFLLNPTLLFEMPGGSEWLIILLGVIILFGGKKIPELAKGIGKGIRNFNDAKDGVKKDIETGMKDESTGPKNAGELNQASRNDGIQGSTNKETHQ